MLILKPYEKILIYKSRQQKLADKVCLELDEAYEVQKKINKLQDKITKLTKKMIG